MKKSELKSFIREEIISTLSEDLDELEDQLDVVDQKLDAVISKKEEAGVNEQVDKFNVDVFGYKTKYYKVCPGAKAFMDKVMDGAYGDMSQKQNEVIRIAKLHDLLFIRELKALKDSNYADQVIPQVEYIAEEIKDNVQLLGIPVADVDYVDNHVEIIKDAAKKKDQIATDDMLEEGDLFSSKFDRQELKAIINDLNKDLILDMPTRRAYKFLVSLLDKEDKEEMGLGKPSVTITNEQMYIDDDEFEMEMGRSKKDSLKKEMMIHVDQLIDGNIDMNDFMNVVEDVMAEVNSLSEDIEEPSDEEIKKNKSIAKAAEELAVLQSEMRTLAREYSKAKGDKKEQLLAKLKVKTKKKKELEKLID
jgi:cellobiose-specific phosphotransferase system component IIB